MNPEPFLQLDRVIHEKGRLAIMSMLAATPELSFTELRDALSRFKVYALAPDLEARGMHERVMEGVATVDYGGFVDLVAEHKNCQSWL